MERRQFIEWLGLGAISVGLLPYRVAGSGRKASGDITVNPIDPTDKDDLVLAEGLDHDLLVKWGDAISDTHSFGFNNDFTCFIPMEDRQDEGILWVNHEYVDPYFIHGNECAQTGEHVKAEQYEVGGSLLHIHKSGRQWAIKKDSKYNRRITAETIIPFNWDAPIAAGREAKGTLGNCAGGLTPWGTILTCEENYQNFYGERPHGETDVKGSINGWERFDPNPPEHYGWVVEVDPFTGSAQKHVALGRCAHECATIQKLSDGRIVVYTGDDKNDEHLYKFVSKYPGSLKEGTLYVAQLETGKWLSLDIEHQPKLAEVFKDQTEVLVYLRKAAKMVGATPLDRPEDIEIDPVTGHVLVTLTNNIPKGNYYGSILKLEEGDGNHDALFFRSSTFLTGGEDTGFAAPDNMIFDRKGNLWFTSDISGSKMNKPPYAAFKNNGLFLVMRGGDQAGKVLQVASAPRDAELTGPWFSPDGKTLFLSVQHPGEQSSKKGSYTSHWPGGSTDIPRSAVVALYGDLIDRVQGL